MEEHKKLWLSLNPLYPEVKPFLKTYPNKERLYIITTKKTTFVAEILKANKIELSFDHLFHAKEKTKSEIIFDLLNKHNISKTDFFFIDDQVDTLVKTLETGVHCLLAEWGYNNEIQREKAKKNNIRILSLAQFTSQFKPG
jgi:phosphoglycolate phosphatase-like HAD superfamily hydrolase